MKLTNYEAQAVLFYREYPPFFLQNSPGLTPAWFGCIFKYVPIVSFEPASYCLTGRLKLFTFLSLPFVCKALEERNHIFILKLLQSEYLCPPKIYMLKSADTLILDFPSFRTVSNKFVTINYPV
jgi:hypothetical protein